MEIHSENWGSFTFFFSLATIEAFALKGENKKKQELVFTESRWLALDLSQV